MATSVGDIIRITLCQNVANQSVCNVFSYVVDSLTGSVTIGEIVDRFVDVIVPDINGVQGTNTLNVSALDENLSNGIDFAETTVTGGGALPFANEPTFVALSFRYNRGTKVTRSGFKRIAGVSENLSANTNNWDDTDASILTLAARLQLGMTVPGALPADTAQVDPIILGTLPNGQPDLGRWQKPVSVTAQAQKTSQVTRKIGRGS